MTLIKKSCTTNRRQIAQPKSHFCIQDEMPRVGVDACFLETFQGDSSVHQVTIEHNRRVNFFSELLAHAVMNAMNRNTTHNDDYWGST